MKVVELAQLVRDMRDAQKQFWGLKGNDPDKNSALITSKQIEAKVDKALDEILGSSLAALFH